ncbi:MAG: tRNA dimethylallyltransferase [Planctomycetes bacterium ADurb.Bin126]|nr:MAG: tRNA dimethylallyltransferase [Planctomycetes bacterium ADurb.Bin126]HOD80757.1 tRNA (adenosine(37)-N6)-dimethylallyltransferase MiaA [Phycisphaerae bacterium]HQL71751.1 tRNA (adenosine(37)-N6)-dimethylallyltransferase MiaA [Phycisphaerae bacterium]
MNKLYLILGCTACGKGAVGRALARRLGAEIVSVDSMKVYRRMDIGTAKPPPAVRAEIPHHGIDLVEPWEPFSVAQYLAAADAAIADIHSRGRIPLAVGGTSLYIKALTEGLFDQGSADPAIRVELEGRADAEGLPALHAELARVDAEAAARIHPNDRKRIVRALEVHRLTGQPISRLQSQWDAGQSRYDCVRIGLRRDKDEQSRRINLRATRMVQAGLRDEVAALLADPHGLAPQAAQAVGYAEMIDHLAGRCTLDDALEQIKINTRRLAKKQRTWHRRWGDVLWFDTTGQDDPNPIADRLLREVFAR